MATILTQDEHGIRTLTLNRPDRRNALTPEMQQELIDALDDVSRTESIRVLVLTGAGEAFCAGLDLSALQAMRGRSALELADDAHRIARIFRTLYELPVPTIAAVNGHAIAGGAGLATICDFTLAVPSAKLGYTEVKIGFIPALVSAYLSLQVGDKRARDLLLTGRLLSADEAQRIGLVSQILPREALLARVHELAQTLVANSPGSLRATKLLLAEQNRLWLDHAIDAALKANASIRDTPDFQEGVSAFLEKRKPAWSA